MPTLVVDADGPCYKAAASVQRTFNWGGVVSTTSDLDEAKRILHDDITSAMDRSGCETVVLCWSSKPYFRNDVLPTYKANRVGAVPPVALKPLREWAKGRWPKKEKDRLEADDVVGILATHPKIIGGEKIVYSLDKDLEQIPGLHYVLGEGVYRIQPEFADRFLWTQVLTGDSSDGYTGIPGIGPKKAERILTEATPDNWAAVLMAAYHSHGLALADLAVQFNVARIVRASDYNFKTGEVILWQPT